LLYLSIYPSLHPRLIINKPALFRATIAADSRWRLHSECW